MYDKLFSTLKHDASFILFSFCMYLHFYLLSLWWKKKNEQNKNKISNNNIHHILAEIPVPNVSAASFRYIATFGVATKHHHINYIHCMDTQHFPLVVRVRCFFFFLAIVIIQLWVAEIPLRDDRRELSATYRSRCLCSYPFTFI